MNSMALYNFQALNMSSADHIPDREIGCNGEVPA
jgi:hypothetical protein